MRPNAKIADSCTPDYLRELIDNSEFSQQETARRIGVSPRMMRYYLAGMFPIPYRVQYAVENLTGANLK